ncbi:DNA phosphorothioation-dependent restriction protein DptG, partial [Mycobacterium tuberculosis]|uniref:DNA phosphorothioation-dependent restriction protein DptG n=1 Tax=Mycobacterium tuberculosis TaxID=1773 RepID=UPI000930A66C
LLLKFEQFEKANYSVATPLYYALDWEGVISKRRKAASDIEGFKRIKEISPFLFPHIHTMTQLSTFTDNTSNHFYSYVELINIFTNSEKETNYLSDINKWLEKYRLIFGERVSIKEPANDLPSAFR